MCTRHFHTQKLTKQPEGREHQRSTSRTNASQQFTHANLEIANQLNVAYTERSKGAEIQQLRARACTRREQDLERKERKKKKTVTWSISAKRRAPALDRSE